MENPYFPLRLISIVAILLSITELPIAIHTTIFHYRNRRKLESFSLFGVLSLLSAIDLIVSNFFKPVGIWDAILGTKFTYHFTYFEFIILFYVLIGILNNQKHKFILNLILYITILFAVFDTFTGSRYIGQYNEFFVLFFSFNLLSTCLAIFSQLILSKEIIDLSKSYKFRFATIVFILYSVSTPLYYFTSIIRESYISKDLKIVVEISITIFYCLLYLMLTKASKCKIAHP